ncbi:MAG: benzoate-CoA ligase family protein [Gammaproteobacteria bacterium]|nr:benzoate-CoA ligase family protein [Gammaproteobacteria bacterium]
MNLASDNAASYFVDRHRDTPVAGKPAFIESDGQQRSISYAELSTQSAKMVDLFARHHINREDRVALLLLDQIEFPVVFWGALKAGVIPVPLNTLLATDIYATILEDSRAKAVFVSAALLDRLTPILDNHPYIKTVFVVGDDDSGAQTSSFKSFNTELDLCSEKESVLVSADETAFWLYSSGSTGQPKGVRHVHGSLLHSFETYGQQVLSIHSDDIVYSAAKFFFAYGLGNAMTFPMAVGATTILLSGRPTPEVVVQLLNSHSPSIFCGVPTLYAALLAHLESHPGLLQVNLRRCISAGEALPEDVGRNWEAIAGCEILDGVGSTEMLHIFLSNRSGEVVYGTSGVAVPGYELRLVNEEGVEVSPGEIGELLVNGESAASDYWNQRAKSRATFEGVWTRTGDKYEKMDDGRYTYCGRTDDMFKVSGIWLSPFEVEQSLVSHPDVLEAAVVPQRDDDDLEKPKAFVVLKNSAIGQDLTKILKEHVKSSIGQWKYPRWIEFVDELPKTATGKIQRFKLRNPV